MPIMANDDMKQAQAEQERILALPGRAAWVKLERLSRTARIFAGNANVLLAHLDRMQDPAVMLQTTSNQRALEEFLDETERHLHNYVAAAQSRVDHFRQFVRSEWPEGSPLREEYQQRIDKEFKTSPLHNFIIKLRQLIQHVRLPVSTTREHWERGGAWTFQVMLDSADLLRWEDWNPPARQYVEASGKSVDLHQTVSTYSNEILAFDRWVAECFIGEHLEEIESYHQAVQQFQERLRQLGLRDYPEAT
jgi:hypothetical protein